MIKHTRIHRLFSHLLTPPWLVNRYFPKITMQRIQKAITESECLHNGEICFAVESNLNMIEVLNKKFGRKRAIEVFSQLRVWDTEQNNGVLIYLLLADHDFEIVADRGIHQHVGKATWENICQQMETHFKNGEFEAGVLLGIEKITDLMQQYYPPQPRNPNELPNAPVVL